jgi:hypothetical protein
MGAHSVSHASDLAIRLGNDYSVTLVVECRLQWMYVVGGYDTPSPLLWS